MQEHPETFDQTFSSALDRALEGVLGRAARITSFYVDPGMSTKSPDGYVELLKKIFSPELVNSLVAAIGLELSKSFGFRFYGDMNWKLSDYVSYAQQPLQLRLEPDSGNVFAVGTDKEMRITMSNRTVGGMLVRNCDLRLSPELSLVEPCKPALDSQGLQLHPGEARTLNAKIRAEQVGQARISARAVIVDLRGRTKPIEVPCVLYVVEREGRLATGSSILDGLLLGGLPRRSAVLLASVPCDEKDNIVQSFCGRAPGTTVYVSSDVDRSIQLHKLFPGLRLVVCSPQAELLPRDSSVQVSRSLDNISQIDDLVMHALETIPDESPRVFIQLISDILLLHREVTTRHWLADLLPRLRARQCTVLAELNSGMHEAREMNALFDLFDGRLEIVEDDEIGQPIRSLRVVSLRGRKYLPQRAALTSPATEIRFEEYKPIPSSAAPSSAEYEQLLGERRLAAIMFTDMVGYTALTQSNENRALAVLNNHNKLIRPVFPRFNGREIKTMGDSFMVEFDSALDATNCAIEIQRLVHDYNASTQPEWRISLRVGVHLGDVVHSRGDVLGDAVNVASRIQPLAEPEGVCVSQQVYDQVRNKLAYEFTKLESRDLKNVQYPVNIYKIVLPWNRPPPSTAD